MFKLASRPLFLALLGSFFLAIFGCVGSPAPSSIFVVDAGSDATAGIGDSAPMGDDSSPPIPLGGDGGPLGGQGDACTADTCDGSMGFCGDGILQPPEVCDDGNSAPGDGCSGACLVEPGWACPVPGKPCVKIWVCGNGHIDPGEQCDDSNTMAGDGCSSTCQVEPGYTCPNRNGVGGTCIPLTSNVCGDGIVAGTEQCDDGNTTSGDGCSSTCMLEAGYTCPTAGAPCKPIEFCGDGVLNLDIGEQCDDGNKTSGDGCSSLCQIEPNFVCTTPGQLCVSTVRCGDGKIQGSETCDDGNATSGDGCSSACQVESGWQCPTPGVQCVAICGDGLLRGSEQCDDGNTLANDGCSATCQVEPGFACVASTTPPPASTCHRTVCGDGIKEGSEQCDDGNLIPYDGCSPTCTIDPKCGNGICTSSCGDGLVFPNEQCDLGGLNGLASTSGCSTACQENAGWSCTNAPQPPAATLVIPILYRDMLYFNTTSFPVPRPVGGGHPDFQRYGCVGALQPPACVNTLVTGLVMPTLDAFSKPQFASVGNPVALSDPTGVGFCWWYHDTGCGGGGANPYANLVYLDAVGRPTTLTLTPSAPGSSVYTFSTFAFFPLDGLGWNAGTNPQTSPTAPNCADTGSHNFSFTSELHYIFTYQQSIAASATPAVFNFTGDDDVWAFINDRLVVDLGGLHQATNAIYTLNTTNAAALGLTDGGWYSIDLFQAERFTCASNYTLALSNFAHIVTQCSPVCGDGIVVGNEQCDEGALNGTGYGHCSSTCTLGPRCGDGVVQNPPEQCDDGVNLTTYGNFSKVCGPGCKFAPYCGDGVVSNGEQCDEGALNGSGYGHCTDSCTLGPRCGDGILQAPPEQCDDGINNGASGSRCDATCMLKCGNGVIDPGEQCDRGVAGNTSGYGGCNADCTLGPYCGDAVVQNPPEQCDYGVANNTGGYGGCNSTCTLGPYCGDGIVQNPPEQCDNGPNNVAPAGAYGMGVCTFACMPAAYCGDGIVQMQFGEQCDGTSDCNTMCQFLVPK
jgi:fibro-slime domain-containing protein